MNAHLTYVDNDDAIITVLGYVARHERVSKASATCVGPKILADKTPLSNEGDTAFLPESLTW